VLAFLGHHAITILEDLSAPEAFSCNLDKWTNGLKSCSGATWGTARKSLNIVIRDATYNFYLRREFSLAAVEHKLELPLDSFSANGLRCDAEQADIPLPPQWESIKSLCPEVSDCFQRVAAQLASRKNVHRCHLDVWYWRADQAATERI
jgi:hypothetical protein